MVFSEKQKLSNLGFKLLYGVTTATAIAIVFFTEHEGREANFGNWLFLVGLAVFLAAIYFLVFETSAFTKVNRKGISYKYRPFVWNYKCISWKEIESAKLHPINPLKDFGGWGFRFGGRKGKAIVMSSGYGVVIMKNSGKRFTITTQRKLELERAIGFWMNENEHNG